MLGVQKIIAVHYFQSTEIQVFPVNQCGRWFSAPQLYASLVALQASRLSPWVPTDEFSYLAFEVSLLGVGCALFCCLLTQAQTLLFQTFPGKLDTGWAIEELWCLLGELVSQK